MRYKSLGVAVIINNVTFNTSPKLDERRWSDTDAIHLYKCFQNLGFTDIRPFKNLTCEGIRERLRKVASMNHSDHAVFVCAILSHGEMDKIYGTDGCMLLQEIFDLVKIGNSRGLAGKPKFFIIQACRGPNYDNGASTSTIRTDGPCLSRAVDVVDSYIIPADADFLFAYSTVPGFRSWRKYGLGSFFIRALTEELQSQGRTREIVSILTRVNRRVALEFESHTPADPATDKKKQMPCIATMLTKELYFAR